MIYYRLPIIRPAVAGSYPDHAKYLADPKIEERTNPPTEPDQTSGSRTLLSHATPASIIGAQFFQNDQQQHIKIGPDLPEIELPNPIPTSPVLLHMTDNNLI